MTDTNEISEAITVKELFEKSKIDFSESYADNFQQSYDNGDLSIAELEDFIDSVKTVKKAFKNESKNNKNDPSEITIISLAQLYSDGELDEGELKDLISKIPLVEEIYADNEIEVSDIALIESARDYVKEKLTFNELTTLVLLENELNSNGIEYSKDYSIYLIQALEEELSIEEYNFVPETVSTVLDVINKNEIAFPPSYVKDLVRVYIKRELTDDELNELVLKVDESYVVLR